MHANGAFYDSDKKCYCTHRKKLNISMIEKQQFNILEKQKKSISLGFVFVILKPFSVSGPAVGTRESNFLL